MDCQARTMQKLRGDLDIIQVWSCECDSNISDFITINYQPRKIYTDVNTRPLPEPGHVQLYTAGPPCQGFSSAGRRNTWEDPRPRLYIIAIEAIERAAPEAFLLEHSDNLKFVHGRISKRITTRPAARGYEVRDKVTNTNNYG